MSDERLQELRRRVTSGDWDAEPALEAAECRVNGHQWWRWKVGPRFLPKWARVEICTNCLAIQSIRARDLATPEVFTLRKSRPWRSAQATPIFHVAVKASTNYTSSVTCLCGNSLALTDIQERLDECETPASCKHCLRMLERVNKSNLRGKSHEVYLSLYRNLPVP